jgi:hypothetical protein
MIQHRGAKPGSRYELSSRISLLSLAYLLSIDGSITFIDPVITTRFNRFYLYHACSNSVSYSQPVFISLSLIPAFVYPRYSNEGYRPSITNQL